MVLGTKEFSEFCWNENARIEWIIPLGAAHDSMSCGDVIGEWYDEALSEDLLEAFPDIAELLDEKDSPSLDTFLNWLGESRKEGFLIKASFCIRTPSHGDYSCSWGHYTSHAFYVPTLEAFPDVFKAWVKRLAEEKK